MSTLLYTIPEVMREMRVGKTSVYQLIRTGELKSIKVGGVRRVPAAAVDDYIADRLSSPENNTFRYVTQAGE